MLLTEEEKKILKKQNDSSAKYTLVCALLLAGYYLYQAYETKQITPLIIAAIFATAAIVSYKLR